MCVRVWEREEGRGGRRESLTIWAPSAVQGLPGLTVETLLSENQPPRLLFLRRGDATCSRGAYCLSDVSPPGLLFSICLIAYFAHLRFCSQLSVTASPKRQRGHVAGCDVRLDLSHCRCTVSAEYQPAVHTRLNRPAHRLSLSPHIHTSHTHLCLPSLSSRISLPPLCPISLLPPLSPSSLSHLSPPASLSLLSLPQDLLS